MDLQGHAWRSPRGLQAYNSNENRCQTYLSETVSYESQVHFANPGRNKQID